MLVSKTSVYMRGKEEAEKELEQREKQNLEEYYKGITNSLNI